MISMLVRPVVQDRPASNERVKGAHRTQTKQRAGGQQTSHQLRSATSLERLSLQRTLDFHQSDLGVVCDMEDLAHRLSIFLLLLSTAYCSGSQWADMQVVRVEPKLAANRSIYLVAILPNDIVYLPSFAKVGPALKLAMDKVVQQQLLPGYRLQLSFRNSRCSNTYAPYVAIEAYKLNEVHVFFGPSCDFALGKTIFYSTHPIIWNHTELFTSSSIIFFPFPFPSS